MTSTAGKERDAEGAGSENRMSRDERAGGELQRLRDRLREAEETLDAIRNGDVDAVVVSGKDDIPRVYALETADESYRLLVEEMQEGALTLTKTGDVLYCNARLGQLVGTEPAKLAGGSLRELVAESEWPNVLDMIARGSKGEVILQSEVRAGIPTHMSFSPLRGVTLDGEEMYCAIVTDLTEQRRTADELRAAHAALLMQVAERERTEGLLRQSQKMEAVGQLTGGIAHDFNNLLMVITGGLSILERTPSPERHQRLHEGMRQAAQRGAALVRQLLAFSRQKELHPKTIVIPRHLEGMHELLNASLGGNIRVRTNFAPDVWPVRADEGEFEIALLNLCVNARDAMPGGGTITIAARNRPNLHDFALSGDFVEVSVIDTGEGMDAQTIARCLEPFYTTKDVGKGSGLGLAQVYGFAHGSHGSVQIESEARRGTRVMLLLPRSEPPVEVQHSAVAPGNREKQPPGAPKKVLLVEDDTAVAVLTTDMLQVLGYDVVRVESAHAGLKALAEPDRFELVLSDIMMPGGMDGVAFVREFRSRGIDLPVVLVSGFADAARRAPANASIPVLAKPYGLDQLARVLNQAVCERNALPQRGPGGESL